MMTCGLPCGSCASLTRSLSLSFFIFSLFLLQLSAPQVHLDNVRVHSTLTKQPCACTHPPPLNLPGTPRSDAKTYNN